MVVACLAGTLMLTGCGQVNIIRAKLAFWEANGLYQAQDYRGAAAKYEEALAANPNLTIAYFFLANSYDNLYRPARRGQPANDALLVRAVENYTKAATQEPDPRIRKLALEYLMEAYGRLGRGRP